MHIMVKKFGEVLTSRQSGREAYAAFRPVLAEAKAKDDMVIDFAGVKVLAPSWADEFLTPLLEQYDSRLRIAGDTNASVRLSLEMLEEISGKSFPRGGR